MTAIVKRLRPEMTPQGLLPQLNNQARPSINVRTVNIALSVIVLCVIAWDFTNITKCKPSPLLVMLSINVCLVFAYEFFNSHSINS